MLRRSTHHRAALVRHLGERDSIADPQAFKKQKDLLDGRSKLHVYPGQGHRVYEAPDFWNNVLGNP